MSRYHFLAKCRDVGILILLISWKVFAILFRTALGLAFFVTYYSLGTKWEWLYPLPIGIVLGFAPWGWKVEAILKNEARERKLALMSDSYYYSEFKVEIRQRSLIVDLVIITFKLLLNGILGILLGWKAFFHIVSEIIVDLKMLVQVILA